MNDTDAPGPRIDAAKRAAQGLVDQLPDQAAMALLTYGTGTGSSDAEKAAGCQDVKVLIPMSPLDHAQMQTQIAGLAASGYTPISLALRAAMQQLPDGDQPVAIVLVSDGEDTCDELPCDTARQAKQSHPNLTVSTVGFKTEGVASEQLRCIAAETGGIFVQAANADQLGARLLATQDLNEAKKSLSDSGFGGIELGSTLADIRKAHRDFPDASTSGTVRVVYLDCDFVFVDGVLDSIEPHGGGRTIDGVAPGTPLSRVGELYGDPVVTESDGQGGYRVTYRADPGTDAGYRMVVEGYSESNGAVSGTVKTIVLCRCAPKAGSAPQQVNLPEAPPPVPGCSANVIDHRDISHRTLGAVRLFLHLGPQRGGGTSSCVVAVTGSGQMLPSVPIDATDKLAFADPVTDATGNAFVAYNPGRYNGVLVLVPTADGFQDIGWGDRSGTHYSGRHAYYNAELGPLGADGNYTIRQFRRETPPGCMGNPCQITTSQDLHWNGTDYVP